MALATRETQHQLPTAPLSQRVMASCPWRDGINTCLKCGKATLSSRDPLYKCRESVQLACLPCAQEELYAYECVSQSSRAFLEHFAHSEMGFYHCEDCGQVFSSEIDAMQHTNATRNVEQSQCILSGPYVEFGKGKIVPFIDTFACPSAITSCKYCGQTMQVDQWVHHVRTECDKVPCALCLYSITDATTTYARQKLDGRKANTMMHCQHIFEPFNAGTQCNYGHGTFKEMLRHMQLDSGEHRRGLQCMRSFVTHVNEEAASAHTGVAQSPLQLVTVGATPFSYTDAAYENDTPTGVSCKSPRCSSAMVVNVAGKCPELVRRQSAEAAALAEHESDADNLDARAISANVAAQPPVVKVKRKRKKGVCKKPKCTSKQRGIKTKRKGAVHRKDSVHKDTHSPPKMPIRLMMKLKRANEATCFQGTDVGQPNKKRRRKNNSSELIQVDTTCASVPVPVTSSTTTMITTSMITSSLITATTSDPTLRVVVARPQARKPPPPPQKNKRTKPPPPPYPPPPLPQKNPAGATKIA